MMEKLEKKKQKQKTEILLKTTSRKESAGSVAFEVCAGWLFPFFSSVQSELNLGLGETKFSKLRQVYGQKELGALLKRAQARKEKMDALER